MMGIQIKKMKCHFMMVSKVYQQKLTALENTLKSQYENPGPDRSSQYLKAKYKWKAIDDQHQQLMKGKAVARLNQFDHIPYSAHVTLSKAMDLGTE